MRLLDFLLRTEGLPEDRWFKAVKNDCAGAVVLDVNNVHAWFNEHVKEEAGEARLRMFDRCVPPFKKTFVEFRANPVVHVGILVYRTQDHDGDGWTLNAFTCISDLSTKVMVAPELLGLPVSSEGEPNWAALTYQAKNGIDDVDDREALKDRVDAFCVALLAFRFAHAKGVEVVEHRAPRQERRRAEREGSPAPTTYRTLEIAPITKRLKDAGVDEIGLTKALHLCRGHFADYTKGAGLFGKYKVEVFVPEHFKGRRERGLVEKDYRIASPALSGSAGITIPAGQSSSPEASAA